MSYQPEERYWTDYLRIALPVVGLLLMLGLFWFWATSLIGDEDDDDPANLAANVATATATAVPQVPATTETTGGAPAGNTGVGETPTVPLGDSGSTEGNIDPAPANEANGEETVAVDEGADTGEATDEESADAESPVCDDGDFCTGVFAEVTSDGVNLREEPGLEGAVVDQLSTGAEVVITGDPQELDDFTWVPVETDLGDGYVTTDFLQRTN